MSDEYNVRAESARLGGLSSYGRTPDPGEKTDAERRLATARIDREIRDMSRKYGSLAPQQVAHLIGLLLGESGVKYDVATTIERSVRQAVEAAQSEEA